MSKSTPQCGQRFKYEKSFFESSNVLMTHLKGKPECRELMNELTAGEPDPQQSPGPSRAAEA